MGAQGLGSLFRGCFQVYEWGKSVQEIGLWGVNSLGIFSGFDEYFGRILSFLFCFIHIFCVLAWMEGKDLEKRIKDNYWGDFSWGLIGNYFFGLRRSGEGAMMPKR